MLYFYGHHVGSWPEMLRNHTEDQRIIANSILRINSYRSYCFRTLQPKLKPTPATYTMHDPIEYVLLTL